jgi:hypothetical protein
MIRFPLLPSAAASLAASLILAAAPAAAQQQPAQQRSGTPAAKPQPAPAQQPRGGAAQAKPAAGAKPATAAKPAAQAAAPAPGPGGAQTALLQSFGDWNVYVAGQGRSKMCYALSQPKTREPKDLKRDPGYLFVSFQPASNVRNEIAVMMGFPTNGTDGEAAIGSTAYSLVTQGTNAWVKNVAEQGQVVATMSKGQALLVKAKSVRGNQTTDRYSLSGFGPALERARKECS